MIETIRQTGIDMSHKHKESSQGRLALNLVQCRAAIDKGAAGGKLRE